MALIALLLRLFQLTLVLGQTLKVVEKTSYPFSTPGNTQEFELAGTGTDGATTLLDRIRVSEYLVLDDAHSTPFLSTATAVSTYTQTFVAVGSSAYQIIYAPTEEGAVAISQSCAFEGQDKGQCVEKDWVVGLSSTSTQTTTFSGPAVPYWTVTGFAAAAASTATQSTTISSAASTATQTQTSTTSNQNSGISYCIPLRLVMSLMMFMYIMM